MSTSEERILTSREHEYVSLQIFVQDSDRFNEITPHKRLAGHIIRLLPIVCLASVGLQADIKWEAVK